jgi:hypothetical protein
MTLKNCLLSYLFITVTAILLTQVPLNIQMRSSDELEEGLRQANPVAYEKAKGHILAGFSVSCFL